jgi:hypothetical protein
LGSSNSDGVGIAPMIWNWIFEHAERLTLLAILAMLAFMLVGLSILASSKKPEADELEGFPDGKR